MANKIQIKRSTSTVSVSGLSNGELAFTQASNTLWIGLPDGSGVASIAGVRNPGVLTANQALVANATSYMDVIKTANLYIGVATVNQINAFANSTILGNNANNELTTTWAIKTYVDGRAAEAGAGSVTSISTGDGLTGGPITSSGTISVLANSGIVANTSGLWAKAANGISVTSDGINVAAGNSQIISNTSGIWIAQAQIDHNSLANYVADQHIDHTTITLTAGSGLTGGGTIAANRTFDIGAGVGIIVNTDDVAVKANNGIVANTSGLWAKAANGISVTSDGINVAAGTGVVSNTSGVHIGQDVATTSSVTFANVVTTDMTISGNLTVSGTTTTIGTTTLSVRDNMIVVADDQASTSSFTDFVDGGFFVPTGNTLNTFYSGIARIAASSSNTNPYFKLFATGTAPNSTVIATSADTGTLQAFLAPWGAGGAFVVNSTAMALTANTTVSLSLVANTLSLTTALPVTSGGIGHSSITTGDLLVGNSDNILTKLSAGADGTVLQISGTSVVYASLDAGTF